MDTPSNPVAAVASFTRPQFSFTFPEGARMFPTDPRVVVLQPITIGEERLANRSAEDKQTEFGVEAVKHALVSADGQPLSWDAGVRERFLESLSPPVRQLLVAAYSRIHLPKKEDTDSFFASMKAVV